MKLQFDKVEEIGFGELQAKPSLTTELRLRISALRFDTEADLEEAKDVLSDAFPSDKSAVRAFMDESMASFNLRILQAYLIGGPQMVEKIDKQMTNLILEERKND